MRNVKIILSFLPFSNAELLVFARSVLQKMTKNSYFPTPDISLTDLSKNVDEFERLLSMARNGGKQVTAEVNQLRKIIEKQLRLTAAYVDRIADGDEAVILSAGFETNRQRASALHAEFSVKHNEGENSVVLSHKAIKGAKSYSWQLSKDPLPKDVSFWTWAGFSTQCKIKINNLEHGIKYWFRVAAITPEGLQPWCDTVLKEV
jgi:hypothetical protein